MQGHARGDRRDGPLPADEGCGFGAADRETGRRDEDPTLLAEPDPGRLVPRRAGGRALHAAANFLDFGDPDGARRTVVVGSILAVLLFAAALLLDLPEQHQHAARAGPRLRSTSVRAAASPLEGGHPGLRHLLPAADGPRGAAGDLQPRADHPRPVRAGDGVFDHLQVGRRFALGSGARGCGRQPSSLKNRSPSDCPETSLCEP